ncbi:response regulator [Gracilibacillus salinarum]|uniref:Response regulator n=1 Tax=Gracilibacillus salinarum TaxID=2932255 RepID=A0ABY4GR72_9BACI|nr:response regulator [Gracilibacillus salinarum]UOQ86860.1 response regulator [Gracilibacillus salinarum]
MNVILFDDEEPALNFLEHQLKLVKNVTILGKYTHTNITAILDQIRRSDCVFLDVKMPELNGIELAEKLLEINPQLAIIFVTAYDRYAIQAFELNALDYLLKPVYLDRLKKTVERLDLYMQYKTTIKTLKGSHSLTIQVLGAFTFQMNESDKQIISWRTTNAQNLFIYFLHHHDKVITKDEIIELFFSNTNIEKAYSLLYVTIYQIRQALLDFSSFLSIHNVQSGYMLKLHSNTCIDKEIWEKKLHTAPAINLETVEIHDHLLHSYHGPYLKNYDFVWLESERYRLEKLWVNHALKLAHYYLDHHYLEKAALWFNQTLEVMPENENAHYELMRIYAEEGFGVLVTSHYQQLIHNLEELNLPLSREIDKWYHDWKLSSKY